MIHRFSRRPNTGGLGRHNGGDGCVRDIEFTVDLDVAILSQRRVIPPYGMAGGEPGMVGRNEWMKCKGKSYGKKSNAEQKINGNGNVSAKTMEQNGHTEEEDDQQEYEYSVINLGGSNQARMRAGDRIVIRRSHSTGFTAKLKLYRDSWWRRVWCSRDGR